MDSNFTFSTEYVVEAYGKYYFVASEMNVVCSFSRREKKVEIIGGIPDEALFSKRLCTKLLVWEEELIIIPMNGKRIWFFHIAEKKWRKICIESEYIQRKIRQAFIYHGCLFMVGCHYPAIICLDLKTEKIKYLETPFKRIQNFYEAPEAKVFGYFRHDCVIKGSLLYFASFVTNKVLVLNLDSFQWDYATVGTAADGYSGIAWDGRFFWLAPRNECYVVRWDGEKSYEKFMISYQEKEEQPVYAGVVFQNGNIIFPAMGAKYTVTFYQGNVLDYKLEERKYIFYNVCGNGETIFSDCKGEITVLSEDRKEYHVRCSVSMEELLQKLEITEKEYGQLFEDTFGDVMHENKCIHLCTLLLAIEQKEKAMEANRGNRLPGKTIWKEIS